MLSQYIEAAEAAELIRLQGKAYYYYWQQMAATSPLTSETGQQISVSNNTPLRQDRGIRKETGFCCSFAVGNAFTRLYEEQPLMQLSLHKVQFTWMARRCIASSFSLFVTHKRAQLLLRHQLPSGMAIQTRSIQVSPSMSLEIKYAHSTVYTHFF